MSSSITGKQNPFQKANPFQLQRSYQPASNLSYGTLQMKQQYRSFEPAIDSFNQKQNSFAKPFRAEQQIWKFHEDNCGKANPFNQQSYSRVTERLINDKNSFEKQLVLINVTKKPQQQTVIQEGIIDRFQKVSNPFARKYLLGGGKLVESQVYNGQDNVSVGQHEKYRVEYESYKSIKQAEYENYRYNNYVIPSVPQLYTANQPLVKVQGSINHLETSLHQKYDNQYESRKSFEKEDPYRQVGSFNYISNNVDSRHSSEKERQKMYNNNFQSGNFTPLHSSKNVRGPERDEGIRSPTKVQERQSGQKVKFEESDEEKQYSKYSERKSIEKPPRFGSIKETTQIDGPQSITIHGIKFYKQNVKCY